LKEAYEPLKFLGLPFSNSQDRLEEEAWPGFFPCREKKLNGLYLIFIIYIRISLYNLDTNFEDVLIEQQNEYMSLKKLTKISKI
jgi:hypothetical protein